MDIVSNIIAYENGELDRDETIAFFQELVNSGMVWQLQGSYGRLAMSLLQAKLISLPKKRTAHDPNLGQSPEFTR